MHQPLLRTRCQSHGQSQCWWRTPEDLKKWSSQPQWFQGFSFKCTCIHMKHQKSVLKEWWCSLCILVLLCRNFEPSSLVKQTIFTLNLKLELKLQDFSRDMKLQTQRRGAMKAQMNSGRCARHSGIQAAMLNLGFDGFFFPKNPGVEVVKLEKVLWDIAVFFTTCKKSCNRSCNRSCSNMWFETSGSAKSQA